MASFLFHCDILGANLLWSLVLVELLIHVVLKLPLCVIRLMRAVVLEESHVVLGGVLFGTTITIHLDWDGLSTIRSVLDVVVVYVIVVDDVGYVLGAIVLWGHVHLSRHLGGLHQTVCLRLGGRRSWWVVQRSCSSLELVCTDLGRQLLCWLSHVVTLIDLMHTLHLLLFRL